MVKESTRFDGKINLMGFLTFLLFFSQLNESKDFCCGAKEHREAAVLSGAVPKLLTLLVPSSEAEAVGHHHSLGMVMNPG